MNETTLYSRMVSPFLGMGNKAIGQEGIDRLEVDNHRFPEDCKALADGEQRGISSWPTEERTANASCPGKKVQRTAIRRDFL